MIELRILGPLELRASDGRDVEAVARQSKRAALLSYLAAAVPRGLHRRDRLLTLFWPEASEQRGRAALSQAVYVLRNTLGERAVFTRGDQEVGLDPEAVWCDAVAFESALDAGNPAAALELYRGDLLDGFFATGAPEFEEWVDRQRGRLRQRASEGAWTLAETTARTDAIRAARWARRAADLLPADEAVIRRLMGFLHNLGDRAAAIRAYEAYAWQLAREYELEPSTETQSLVGIIRKEVQRAPWTLAPGSAWDSTAVEPAPSRRRLWAGLSLVAVVGLAVALRVVGMGSSESPPLVRVALEFSSPALSSGTGGSTLALSPDGKRLAYLVRRDDGMQLFIRPMDQPRSVPVPHTRGGSLPFFSPDGAWLGFVAGGQIRKVPLDGGPALTIAEVRSNVPGASWGSPDVIVFATGAGGSALWRVPASGGEPTLLARADSTRRQVYRWPEVLPDGRAAVFTIADSTAFRLAVVSLASGAVWELGVEGTSPHFVAPNYLIFARIDGALLGVRFDPTRLRIDGPVFPVTDGVLVGIAGAAKLSVSRSGVLAYVPESGEDRALMLVDRQGIATPVRVAPSGFGAPRFSPDGSRIAVGAATPAEGWDIWVIDVLRASLARVTFDSGSVTPVWSGDGRRLTIGTKAPGGRSFGFEVRSIAATHGDSARTLLRGEDGQLPADITPDGRVLIFERLDPSTGGDIWTLPLGLPLGREGVPTPYLRTRFAERGPVVSPDGRWLAYVSDESGTDEVYVNAFPRPSVAVPVSVGGGREPRWAPEGRELFYRSRRGLIAATMELTSAVRVSSTQVLFDDSPYVKSDREAAYDVDPNGQRFLMTRRGTASDQVMVLMNWLGDRH